MTITDPALTLPHGQRTSNPMSGPTKSPWESAKNLALGRGKRAGNLNAKARCALSHVKAVVMTTPRPSKLMRMGKKEKSSSSKVRTSPATVMHSHI